MNNLDLATPDQHRARYEQLRANARAAASIFPLSTAIPPLDPGAVRFQEMIPAGWYVPLCLQRWDRLRIVNRAGTPGVSIMIWNKDDVSERYNAGDTVKLQWTARIARGRVLFSDMGRVLASLTEDDYGHHDTILAPNGPDQSMRNGRQNLRLAAGKWGLTRADIAPSIHLFAAVSIDQSGRFSWGGNPPVNATVELRAEMNLLVAISNTPHSLAPMAEATGPIEVVVSRGAPTSADDFCRTATEEAGRGFANTDQYFV